MLINSAIRYNCVLKVPYTENTQSNSNYTTNIVYKLHLLIFNIMFYNAIKNVQFFLDE